MNDREKQVFKLACAAGVGVLESGGETYRAEETVKYICAAAGVESNVLALPTGILISADVNGETQTATVKRVKKRSINLWRLNRINKISRRFVSGEIDVENAFCLIEELNHAKPLNKLLLILFAGLSSLFFTLLFDGSLFDAVVSFFASCTVQAILVNFKQTDIYNFTSNIIAGFVIAFFALTSVSIFSLGSSEAITVGGILPYLPGLAMTNAIRDTMMGDLVSGISRLGEVLLSAVSLAVGAGVVFAVYFALGGVIL